MHKTNPVPDYVSYRIVICAWGHAACVAIPRVDRQIGAKERRITTITAD